LARGAEGHVLGYDLARDLVELPRRKRDRPLLLRLRGKLAPDAHLHVGRGQRKTSLRRLDQHVRQDGLSVASLNDPLQQGESPDQVLPLDTDLHLTPRRAPLCPLCPQARVRRYLAWSIKESSQ